MELRSFFHTLMRWAWLMLLGVAVGVGASFFALRAMGQVPVYQARTVVGLGTQLLGAEQNLEQLYMSRELAPSYVELATLQPVTQAVIDELGLPVTSQALAEDLQVDLIPGTQYLRIAATARDPDQAAAIANAIARQLSAQTPPRLRGFVEVIEPATPPATPSLRPFVGVFVAGLLGLFCALGVIFVVEHLNATVNTVEEAARHLDLPVFGLVRSGQSWWRRLLRRPAPALNLAVTRQPVWWTAIEGSRHVWDGAGQPGGKHILITSPGRAEGKTTAAIGMAMAWARMGLQVALVEGHLEQPALGCALDVKDGAGVAAWLEDEMPPLESVPLSAVHTGELRVLALDQAIQEPLELLPWPRFQRALEAIGRRSDLVVIDGPPLLSTAEATVLASKSDGVLLVVRARKTRLKALKEALKTLEIVGSTVMGVIFTEW
jgi:polysaccharide biosynthesis transport protein